MGWQGNLPALFQMRPSFAIYNPKNSLACDGVFPGKNTASKSMDASPILFANGVNLSFSQCGFSMTFSSGCNALHYPCMFFSARLASLFYFVAHVVGGRAKPQVLRIAAFWVVASGTIVKYLKSFWNWTVREHPSKVVGIFGKVRSISTFIATELPNPTRVWTSRFIHFCPELSFSNFWSSHKRKPSTRSSVKSAQCCGTGTSEWRNVGSLFFAATSRPTQSYQPA